MLIFLLNVLHYLHYPRLSPNDYITTPTPPRRVRLSKRRKVGVMNQKLPNSKLVVSHRDLTEEETSIHVGTHIHINCLRGSVAKASDTQAVGRGLDPRPDH